MSRAVPGALIVFALALTAPGRAGAAPVAAQSAAALAQATAQAAEQAKESAAFDTLVTPEALRALRRLTDSTRVALEAKRQQATSAATTPSRTVGATRQSGAQPRQDAIASADTKDQAIGDVVVDAITLTRGAARSEIRVVAGAAAAPKLSEPFRTAGGTRLFLTFAGATLHADAPPIDSLETILAGVEATQREGDVRLAIDAAASLDRYGLETAGDTIVLWLSAAPQSAAAPATTDAPSYAAASPGDLRLASESARAGWTAFRADVARAGSATGGFAVRAGKAISRAAVGVGDAIAHGASAAAAWFTATVPVGGIARTITFIALLLAPTAGVLLIMRARRPAGKPAAHAAATSSQSARPRPQQARTDDSRAAGPALEVAQITRRTTRDMAPAASAPAAPALTYGPPRPRPLTTQPAVRSNAPSPASPARASKAATTPRTAANDGVPTSPALTRAQRKAEKAIAKAEAKAARIAAKIAANAEREAANAAVKAEREAAKAERLAAKTAARAGKPGTPQVTRTTADARLWAAKTLAASGADAADIARQTGLSREAAGLLVRTSRKAQHTA